MVRKDDLLICLAQNVFGVEPTVTEKLPIYSDLRQFKGKEVYNLLKLRVMCF